MTKRTNQNRLKVIIGEDEEFEVEEIPIHAESIGRPTWWFVGSLFQPRTPHEQKLATLQYQTIARADPFLSERAQRIRKYIGVLSQWFPLPLLDEIGKEMLLKANTRQNNRNLLAHFLGTLELSLRQRQCTIRWAILQEINKTTGIDLEKKDIYGWMFRVLQRKKERPPETLRVVQHLTIEIISQYQLPPNYKRQLYFTVVQAIKTLRSKGFVCKDPEITSWALKRVLLNEKGTQKTIPKEFRTATTQMTFRLRKILKNN
ncbi:MAG: hypothetical protein ACFFC7_22235 [Candidatus Hermodarchaeota archaeon]